MLIIIANRQCFFWVLCKLIRTRSFIRMIILLVGLCSTGVVGLVCIGDWWQRKASVLSLEVCTISIFNSQSSGVRTRFASILRKGRHAFLYLHLRVVLMHGHVLVVRVRHVMRVEMIGRSSIGIEATVVRRVPVPISKSITTSNRLHLIVLLGWLFTLMLFLLNIRIRWYGLLRTVFSTVVLVTLTVVVWRIKRRMGVVMLTTVKWMMICLIHHVLLGLIERSSMILNESFLCWLIFVNFAGHLGGMRSSDFSACSLLRLISHRGSILFIEVRASTLAILQVRIICFRLSWKLHHVARMIGHRSHLSWIEHERRVLVALRGSSSTCRGVGSTRRILLSSAWPSLSRWNHEASVRWETTKGTWRSEGCTHVRHTCARRRHRWHVRVSMWVSKGTHWYVVRMLWVHVRRRLRLYWTMLRLNCQWMAMR